MKRGNGRGPRRSFRRWRAAGAFVVVAATLVCCTLIYVWSRHEATSWGYRLSEAAQAQNELKQTNRELTLEAASLRSPARIEKIARKELGLDFPKPGQIQPLN